MAYRSFLKRVKKNRRRKRPNYQNLERTEERTVVRDDGYLWTIRAEEEERAVILLNLPSLIRYHQVLGHFSKCGQVERILFLMHPDSMLFNRRCIVLMETQEGARRAVDRALPKNTFPRARVRRYSERRATIAAHHFLDVYYFPKSDSTAKIMKGLEDHFADSGDIQGMVFMREIFEGPRPADDDQYWIVCVDFAKRRGRRQATRHLIMGSKRTVKRPHI